MFDLSLQKRPWCGRGTDSCFPKGALRVCVIAQEDCIRQECGRKSHSATSCDITNCVAI